MPYNLTGQKINDLRLNLDENKKIYSILMKSLLQLQVMLVFAGWQVCHITHKKVIKETRLQLPYVKAKVSLYKVKITCKYSKRHIYCIS